jgi:DNA-binding transcriptional MerR regulator
MKMKELEQRSGVSRETIRFYIREGLLPTPYKPKRNVASYDESHLERLEAIRVLVEDPHMTLGLVRRILMGQATPIGEHPGSFPNFAQILEKKLHPKDGDQLVPLANITAKYPQAPRYAKAFETKRIITIRRRRGQSFLSKDDAEILEQWVGTRGKGFKEEYGFGPDGIDPYVEAINAIVAPVAKHFLVHAGGHMSEEDMANTAAVGANSIRVILPLLFERALLRAFKENAMATKRKKR